MLAMTVSAPVAPARSHTGIHHHPSDEHLLALATGGLSVGIRLVTQTHLELCRSCRQRVSMLEAVGGVVLEDQPVARMRADAPVSDVGGEIDLGFLSDAVGFYLRTAHEAAFRAFLKRVGDSSTPPWRMAILVLIDANPGLTQVALARARSI